MNQVEAIGKYRVVGILGEGSMGVVYKVFDPSHGKALALKTVHKSALESAKGQQFRSRLKKEALAACALVHPNIVQVIEYGETEDTPYIVMEYLRGTTLEEFIERKTKFTIKQVVAIGSMILGALDEAHRYKIVHRDIKPANIVVLQDGSIKIMDFGVAKLPGSNSTVKGEILGTPSYISPEQISDKPVDARTDLFATGVLLYELLTGINPFMDETKTRTVFRVMDFTPPVPSRLNDQVINRLDDVILKALEKDPENRFQSALDFELALRKAAQAFI